MRAVAVAVIAVLVVGCSGPETLFSDDERMSPPDYSFVIPAGAGIALDSGQPLEILPAELLVSVGEVIEIRNDDDRGHLVGPFFVGAGELLRQRFASEGTFIGECTVHPSGQIRLVVES